MDAKILAAAKITAPNQNQKKPRHWQAPFALAASVVMVSSVALYLHEENPTAFEAPVPTTQAPAVEMAKPAITNAPDFANAKPLSDKKVASQKTKDAPIAKSEEAQTANADGFNNANGLTALDEKKADSARSVQYSATAKEQEATQAKAETDKFTYSPSAPAAYAPAPQMQPQPEAAEMRPIQTGRLQDSNRANQQLLAASTESNKPAALEKSNSAPALAAAPMAAASMSLGAAAVSPMPTVRQLDKQSANRDEATARADYAQNISAPVLSIDGVAMGMSREQLVTQGLTCYVDVCHLDLNQPQQAMYWGMPTQNAHLTAFISHHVVTKLLLQQKNAQLNTVKKSAIKRRHSKPTVMYRGKRNFVDRSRQLGANIFNVR